MRRQTRRPVLVTALALAATVALAACGSDSKDTSSSAAGGAYGGTTAEASATATTTTAAAGGGTLQLSADAGGALAFDTDTLKAKAGTVTIDLANPAGAGIPHAIAIEGQGVDKDGPVVDPGGTSSVTVKLKPGKYTFYCPVPGHRAGGMTGTLTVS